MAKPPGNDISLSNTDIQFECPCGKNLIVIDEAGSGMSLPCPFCEETIRIPFRHEIGQTAAASTPRAEPGPPTPSPADTPPTPAAAADAPPTPSLIVTPEEPEEPEENPLPVFDFSGKSADELSETIASARSRLKENTSQRTEIQGHINRATIELHRRTIQMRKLMIRQKKIEAEIIALKKAGAPN